MIRDSKVKRITIVGLAALLTFTSGLGFVNASINATEEPLAGINITLDRFVASEASTGIISSIAMARGVEIASDEVISEEIPPIEEVDELAEEEVVEHVKLNLNYDRLGIAKVDTYLNIREKASTNSKIVGKLIKHAGCHIYSVKKGWAKIKSGNVTGYVKKEYLVMDEEAEEMAMEVGTKVVTVMTNGLRVRALPSVDASIYSVLAQDEDFEIYREKLTEAWMEKFIAKHSSKKQVKKIDYDSMLADLENWVCISVDSDYAFV